MRYAIVINGKVWATGLTEEAADVLFCENLELHPDLDIRIEVAR